VAKGSLIVNTKGRRPEADKKYYSTEEPLLSATPLAVLTDRNSASASEIVAGSLQDLDRAVIVGTRTFGKGLVQTIVPLNYGAQLKITTARYYIPSGRSIQEIDYMHKDRDGVFAITPDSLRQEFKTAHGRVVYERGGIAPDSTVKEEELGPMVRELNRKSLFFRFANKYASDHKQTSFNGVTGEVLKDFKKFLDDSGFDYQEESEGKVKELRQIADRSHFSKELLADLDLLSTALEKEKGRGFDRYQDHISTELNIELMSRLNGERGRIAASLRDDVQLAAALCILKDPKLYAKKTGG
jgi:carboxyl-terminal processing protease